MVLPSAGLRHEGAGYLNQTTKARVLRDMLDQLLACNGQPAGLLRLHETKKRCIGLNHCKRDVEKWLPSEITSSSNHVNQ